MLWCGRAPSFGAWPLPAARPLRTARPVPAAVISLRAMWITFPPIDIGLQLAGVVFGGTESFRSEGAHDEQGFCGCRCDGIGGEQYQLGDGTLPIARRWSRLRSVCGAAPSGLRFAGVDTTIRTGGPTGDPGGAGPCSTCGNVGLCIDWKLVGWYGSWDGRQYHHGCKRACRPCGSYEGN